MSLLQGGRARIQDSQGPAVNRDKGGGGGGGGGANNKCQFYVQFLGWLETAGVRGRRYTDPVVHELRSRLTAMAGGGAQAPKLTLQLTHKDLKITQEVAEEGQGPGQGEGRGGRRAGIKKIKFPAISTRDVTYAAQGTLRRASLTLRDRDPDAEDIVACIFLGYMPRTRRFVHVHVYRFDQPATAATFVNLLNNVTDLNVSRIREVERDLAEKGEIEDPALLSPSSLLDSSADLASERSVGTGGAGTDSAAGSGSGDSGEVDGWWRQEEEEEEEEGEGEVEEDLRSLRDVQPFDSVTSELMHRLSLGEAPLLLPPKDYDTISRARGNMNDINERRGLSGLTFTAPQPPPAPAGSGKPAGPDPEPEPPRGRYGSQESGIDLASPGSDSGEVASPFPGGTAAEFVYPPRQERGVGGQARLSSGSGSAAGGLYFRQSSNPSAHSSRTSSLQSEGREAGGDGGGAVFHRSNSSNSFHLSSSNHSFHRSNSSNSFHSLPGVSSALPHHRPPPPPHHHHDRAYIPPTDYDEDDDDNDDPFLGQGPPRRPAAVPGSDVNPLLMRSLPSSALRSDMAAAQSPRGGVWRGEEVGAGGQSRRMSQPVYVGEGRVDTGRQSAGLQGAGMRRVSSTPHYR